MKEIFWTVNAERSYNDVLDYLVKNWTNKEYKRFTERTRQLLSILQNNPNSFQKSDKYPNVRRAILLDMISLYYSVEKTAIHLLFFWDNRRNPDSLNLHP
jgi:plasmid stabilization system protein ParE